MTPFSLSQMVSEFCNARILVIGDVIVDHFIWGSVSRISPEAPVPVVNVKNEEMLLGGSANVLRNLYSLGGKGSLCGIIGDDTMGLQVVDLMNDLEAPVNGLMRGQRPTTVKTRVVAQGQQVVRFDREATGTPSRQSMENLLAYLENHLHEFNGIIVSDYAKGVVCEPVMRHLHQLRLHIQDTDGRLLPLIVDPKPSNLHHFVGATVITPNHHEAEQISGLDIGNDKNGIRIAARQIRDEIDCENVLITLGEAGMALLGKDDELITIPAMAKEVYDVTGAGDTVVATLALGLASGCSLTDAATIANFAASIVVGKVGTAAVTTEELLQFLE